MGVSHTQSGCENGLLGVRCRCGCESHPHLIPTPTFWVWKTLVMGDFNARVGNDVASWKGVIGKHGIHEEATDNGLRLLELCATNGLCVAGTLFEHRDIHKYTWYQRGTDFKSQIDHIIVRQRWRSSLEDTRVYRHAEFNNSDHRLVMAKLRLRLRAEKRPKKIRLNVDRFKSMETQLVYELELQNRFAALGDEFKDVEESWANLRECVTTTALRVCGEVKRKRDAWLNEEVERLAEEKLDAYKTWMGTSGEDKAGLYDEYKVANKMCIKATRRAKQAHWEKKGEELEKEASRGNARAAYKIVEELKGTTQTSADLLRDEKGNIIGSVEGRKRRWQAYYEGLLNPVCAIDLQRAFSGLGPVAEDKPEPEPSLSEIENAIKKLKNNKAAGVDEIHAEALKAGGETLARWIHRLIERIWKEESVPEDWRKSIIVPLFKKGDKSICDNWRGISLLSVVGKVLTHIILERLVATMDGRLAEIQAGFRKSRGCADQIFTLRRVMEETRDECISLFMCFIDLKAAYDTINREALWEIVRRYGVSTKLVRLMQAIYCDTQSAVRVEGELTDWFKINTGLRQGCLLSPMLFNAFIDHVIRESLADMEEHGIEIAYRMPDGRLQRLRGSERILALLYADDLVLISKSEEGMVEMVKRVEEATQRWGLTISVKKTKTLIANNKKACGPYQQVVLRGEGVEQVNEFVYLGSLLDETGTCSKDIARRIGMGAGKFRQLESLWKSPGVRLKTKLSIYRATVLSTVLYGSECWSCTDREYDALDTFNTRRLRAMIGKNKMEISNSDLYKITQMIPLKKVVQRNRLRWAGHVRRMADTRIPKKALFGDVVGGKPRRGRTKINWLQNLEEDCQDVDVIYGQWTTAAGEKNKAVWRRTISSLTSTEKK